MHPLKSRLPVRNIACATLSSDDHTRRGQRRHQSLNDSSSGASLAVRCRRARSTTAADQPPCEGVHALLESVDLGRVSGVAAFRGPGLVAVLAVVPQPRFHAFGEGGHAVAVPFLQRVAGECVPARRR
jgi:hypothetical protein